MRFTTRVFLCTALPAAIFVAALAASLWGLMRTQIEFDRYIGAEQAVAGKLNEMYAQGLQMGQALRNIVLDPANPKAYENFKAAQAEFGKALDETTRVAAGTGFEARVQALGPLREAQAARQVEVIALVKSDAAAAVAALRDAETPAWRALRAPLLDLVADARTRAGEVHAQTQHRAQRLQWLATALSALALLVAGGLFVVLRRTMARELGSDPAEAREALRRIADGDLATAVGGGRPAQGLMGELQRTQERLRALVGEVRSGTDSIQLATSEIAAGNQDLSGRTEQAAASLQQTASSMEQLTSTVRQSSDAAVQASQLALSASAVAQRGGEVVSQVVATMDEINASSQRIADIIGVIDGIAFQTNILALNAAVEAARAGEQGRGFAVVASEVRSLAQRSADAAKEIKSLIGGSVEKVEAGARRAADAGATMQEIVSSVRHVSDIVGQISMAAAEQSDGIGQVNVAVSQLDQATQQNAALVEQSAAAAGSLKEQAERLARVVGTFRIGTAA